MLLQARTVRASPPCAKMVNTPKGVRTQGSVDRRVDASCHGVLLLTTFCMQRLQEINEFTMYLRWPRNLPHEARCNPGRVKRHWCSLTHSSAHCGEGGVNTKTSFRTSKEEKFYPARVTPYNETKEHVHATNTPAIALVSKYFLVASKATIICDRGYMCAVVAPIKRKQNNNPNKSHMSCGS